MFGPKHQSQCLLFKCPGGALTLKSNFLTVKSKGCAMIAKFGNKLYTERKEKMHEVSNLMKNKKK